MEVNELDYLTYLNNLLPKTVIDSNGNSVTVDEKLAIEATIRMNFANFDENYITEPELYSFLKQVKYK